MQQKVKTSNLLFQSLPSVQQVATHFLIHVLPYAGPDGLDRFIEALDKTDGQKFIANELRNATSRDELDVGSQRSLTDREIVYMLMIRMLSLFI